MSKFLEFLEVTISEDQTAAFISFRHQEGVPPDIQLFYPDVIALLQATHNIVGVNEEVLLETINHFNESGEDFEMVEVANSGKPMLKGTDGYLEWLVEREPVLKEDDQGRVDFYAFSVLKNVAQGQLLAKLHDPVPGTDGISVKGEVLSPPPVSEVSYDAGENVDYEEDTKEFHANAAGRIEVRGSQICVSKVFTVDGNVDFSVGNIQFDGFVRVTGNVVDNFVVNATEGVQIDGVLEAAQIRSGGTVVAISGVNCRGKGQVDADGDVLTKFLNNAEVICKGAVKVETEIVNCKVYARAVELPQGDVAGGEIAVQETIDIKEAGSQLGVRTILQVGYNYYLDQEVKQLEKDLGILTLRLKELDHKLGSIKSVMDKLSDAKRSSVTMMIERADKLRKDVENIQQEYETKKRKVRVAEGAITVRSLVHPGVIVRIGRYEKALNQQYDGYRRYQFDKDRYDIVAYFEEEGADAKAAPAKKK